MSKYNKQTGEGVFESPPNPLRSSSRSRSPNPHLSYRPIQTNEESKIPNNGKGDFFLDLLDSNHPNSDSRVRDPTKSSSKASSKKNPNLTQSSREKLLGESSNTGPKKPPKRSKSSEGEKFSRVNSKKDDPSSIKALLSSKDSSVPTEANPKSSSDSQLKAKEILTEKKAESKPKEVSRFSGVNPIQYGLWAHNMSYGAAAMGLFMGAFGLAWLQASAYGCTIKGDVINSNFLYTNNNMCPTKFTTPAGKVKYICCKTNQSTSLNGSLEFGSLYILYSIFTLLFEFVSDYSFGLWYPNDSFLYQNRISMIGILHIVIGIIGCANLITVMPGVFYITAGVVHCYASFRKEAGDGDRERNRKAREQAAIQAKKKEEGAPDACSEFFSYLNPIAFCCRIINEDKLSAYFWIFIFASANIVLFVTTVITWYDIVRSMQNQLLDGTLKISCSDRTCSTNRKAVRYGPISEFAPWAKGFGNCLNMDCSLILLPVIKLLLRKINNAGESFNNLKNSNDCFARFFAHPLTRYIPLSKNIEFHKICAMTIFVFAWMHLFFHLLNLKYSNNTTLQYFRLWGWNGTDYFTGGIVSFAMFMIYTAAQDRVRMAKYEVFFRAHHFFILFFLAMLLHAPSFYIWSCIPIVLYLTERILRLTRGNRPFLLVKVEWIPPVMAVYFRPVFKEDFKFKEGQYLYLNCPHISPSEWHPFTISSAHDDLHFGPRIHLLTGEEVIEIPKPKDLSEGTKWNKYCLVSKDWRKLDPSEYIDKSETGYHDFVSCHIKVHGLEDKGKARTWTRKVKEYFEELSGNGKFPFYFNRIDPRGDVAIGKLTGPDNLQIIRVDGPHSAPSEHYMNYGTAMIVGAGIGLTPCASILCALTKYKWKKNFYPEILHFYWIVRQNEVDSFQWLVHMLTELSFELKRAKKTNQIDKRYYCEINIYVTAVEKAAKDVLPLHRPPTRYMSYDCEPSFTAEDLYSAMLNPSVTSKGQIKRMRDEPKSVNRLQDIWIWNGRPYWEEIFSEIRERREHNDIGVCFCGAPVIGGDLRRMCEKYSSAEDDCLFSLHKENF